MKDFLHHLFLPHESNNHRAKILHHDGLLILILFVFVISFLLNTVHRNFPQVLGIANNITPEALLTLTNQERERQGLKPLHLDGELSQAAAQKASDMFSKNYWAHIAPDGVTPWVFIKNAGYEYLYAGENLARGFNNAQDVVTAWMNSPSHRENILSGNYDDVGFAIATGNLTGSETVLVVQEFGSRYVAQKTNTSDNLTVTYPSPTTPQVALVQLSPTILPSPTIVPSPTEEVPSAPLPKIVTSVPDVAAIQNKPLVNNHNFGQQVAIGIILLLLVVLVTDAIIIERKQIVRVVSHNLDHIIYLVLLLVLVIILGRGIIL
jgi:hypothetical protein